MDDHLRISDVEREAAATEVGEHYAQGRLTTEEHAERLDRIWASRTRGELAPIFRDLPGRYGTAAPAERAVRRPASWSPGPPFRKGVPGPVLAVLAVLVVLTAVTHLPLILAGVLVLLFVAARRRRRHWSG